QFGLSCSPGADNEESMLSLYPEGSWLEAEICETNFRRIVVRSFRVNPPATPKHPPWFVAIAFLLTLPFDFYSYIGQSFLTAFGLVVIAAKLVFLFLYIRHSRFAWHVGVAVTAAITPLSLLLASIGSAPGERAHSHPLFELGV